MFTYVCLGTNDLPRAVRFYDATLAPLGLQQCRTGDDEDGFRGWGTYEDEGRVQLALWVSSPYDGAPATPGNGTMLALQCRSWLQVRQAHEAALGHGGTSDGEPGLRLHYNPDFYAAYVRDPDGNKLAFVCRGFTQEPVERSQT